LSGKIDPKNPSPIYPLTGVRGGIPQANIRPVMKLHPCAGQLRQEALQGIQMRVGSKSPPCHCAPRKSTSDLRETPIRTVVIAESFGLLDEISRLMLAQPEIDLVGVSTRADEALEDVETWSPQVVVMELRVPAINSLKATERLRRKFPAMGIIITSTAEGQAIASRCRIYGADALISKQRLWRDLLSAMRRTIARHALLNPLIP
jgi:CheY-like chemotaxis protein